MRSVASNKLIPCKPLKEWLQSIFHKFDLKSLLASGCSTWVSSWFNAYIWVCPQFAAFGNSIQAFVSLKAESAITLRHGDWSCCRSIHLHLHLQVRDNSDLFYSIWCGSCRVSIKQRISRWGYWVLVSSFGPQQWSCQSIDSQAFLQVNEWLQSCTSFVLVQFLPSIDKLTEPHLEVG